MKETKAAIRDKFANVEYPIHVLGRHVEVTEPIKAYAVDKLRKAERFGLRIIDATITLDIQKLVHIADFVLDVNNTKVKVSGQSENLYASIDQAIDKLHSKLRRYKSRLNDHHAQKRSEIDMNVNVIASPIEEINDEIEEENFARAAAFLAPHKVVSREKRALKNLTQSEAIMKMELSNDFFMIYRSEEDRKLKVIYRRNDGNFGILEPEA